MTKTRKKSKKKMDVEVFVAQETAQPEAPATKTINSKINKNSPRYLFDVIECLKQRVALLEQKVAELETK